MEDEKVIKLNADDKEVALKGAKDLYSAATQLHNWIKEDQLTEEMKKCMCGLFESYYVDIAKVLDYESDLTREKENRYKEIRQKNAKTHELEEKLGSNNPIEGLRERIDLLSDLLIKWWNIEGFNFVREVNYTRAGRCCIDFGFSFTRFSTYSKTPVTDKVNHLSWIEEVKEKGYKLYKATRGREYQMIDCPENRELLTKLLRDRFPGVKIDGWKSVRIYQAKEEIFEIREIQAHIKDLKEIKDLEEYLKEFKEIEED